MAKRKIKLLLTTTCLILVFALVGPVFAGGMAHESVSMSEFFGGGFYNPCYDHGQGELIENLTGDVLIGFKQSQTGYVFHINAANGAGVGATSGDTYRMTGALQEVLANGGNSWTLIHNFVITSGNHDSMFKLKWRIHVTVTPDGELRLNPAVDEVTCS